MPHYSYKKRHRPRQEISRILKYLIFLFNSLFWVCGLILAGLGVYLYVSDFRPILEIMDVFLNPAILLIIIGSLIAIISFFGCTGALRENLWMLRAFACCLFISYVVLVISAFGVFILFYSDAKAGISMQTVLMSALKKYHENRNTAEVMNTIQSQLNCCGVTTYGYKDWSENSLYNCSQENISPEKCAVPFSCCKSQSDRKSPAVGVASVGNSNINAFCGFGAQEKSTSELQNQIYVDGCLHPLQKVFEGHAIIIGSVIGAIIVPVTPFPEKTMAIDEETKNKKIQKQVCYTFGTVHIACISVTLTNILAKQIDHQRYLLAREARRDERRRRRKRSKFRDPFASMDSSDGGGVVVERFVQRKSLDFTTATSPIIQISTLPFSDAIENSISIPLPPSSPAPPPLPPNHPVLVCDLTKQEKRSRKLKKVEGNKKQKRKNKNDTGANSKNEQENDETYQHSDGEVDANSRRVDPAKRRYSVADF
uniref:Tetraspanin n=1 Tax=Romanomermis culicivorax TaxID=13658 RepID=A0A915HN83_ROMCU